MTARLPRLNPKLALAASFVREGAKIADIGCDHGLLVIYLVLSGRAKAGVACDISEKSLRKAALNIEKYRLSEKIEARLGDGVRVVAPEEADDIIIAGIGPDVISHIIESAAWLKNDKKNLILSPATKPHILRGFLYKNGFDIIREEAVLSDGRYYTVMLASYRGAMNAQDNRCIYKGRLSHEKEADKTFLLQQLKFLREKARGETLAGKETELIKIIDSIEEELDCNGHD